MLGCGDGGARAYGAASGDLAWAAPAGPPGVGGVVSLACAATGPGDPIFAACAGGRSVRSLCPTDGAASRARGGAPAAAGKTVPTALASGGPAAALAVGTTGVSLYDPATGKRTARLAGHGGAVAALAWGPPRPGGGRALASAGAGDRAAAVWLVPAGAPSSSRPASSAPPVALLPMDGGSTPASLSTSAGCGGGDGGAPAFRVAALAENGAAARVWEVALPRRGPAHGPPASGAAAAPAAAVTHLADVAPPGGPRTGSGAPGDARLLAVALAPDGGALLVAAGPPGAPSIQRLALPAALPAGGGPVTLIARGDGKAALVTGGGAAAAAGRGRAAANGNGAVSVLEPGAAGGPAKAGVATKRGRVAAAEGGGAAAITTPPPVANGVAIASEEEEEEEGGGGAANGGCAPTTLGGRLAALGVLGAPRPSAAAAADDDLLAAGPAPPRAGTLATLLSQALRAEDGALLERCLTAGAASAAAGRRGSRRRASAAGPPSSLTATVAALAPADAGALLRALVSRLRSRASRGGQLAPWLAATLHCHAAYLVAAPGAARPLADLCDALAARAAAAPALSSLAGRLDLLLAQAGGGAAAARDAAAAAAGGVLPGGGGGEDGGYRESDDAADAAASSGDDDDLSSASDDDDAEEEDGEWATDDEADEDDEDDEDDGMEF